MNNLQIQDKYKLLNLRSNLINKWSIQYKLNLMKRSKHKSPFFCVNISVKHIFFNFFSFLFVQTAIKEIENMEQIDS